MQNYFAMGRLTRDPEQVQVAGTTKTTFSIAINEYYKDKNTGELKSKAVFWDCEVWGDPGRILMEKASKGQEIVLSGAIREDSWNDKTTQEKRYKKVFRVNRYRLVFKDAAGTPGEERGGRPRSPQKPSRQPQDHYDDPYDNPAEDNDDIPF